MTTTRPNGLNGGCYNNGLFYANGADIETEDPCEHCYCLNGDMVCAIQVTKFSFYSHHALQLGLDTSQSGAK